MNNYLFYFRNSGRRARDICIARAALVKLNFELSHEVDILTMELREYFSATLSTSSTAIIVTNNIELKE